MASMKRAIRALKQEPKSSPCVPEAGNTVVSETSLVRWLRSQTPTPQPKNPLPEATDAKDNSASNPHKRRKGNKDKSTSVKDDATKIKTRVRYFINIMMREQTFIDAYSADGWKGQSLEKIRPEQELVRAERRILQSKLKIRQELERLHSLSLEGSIEDSAFEADGQIYFDDIFCAICKSKEVYPENDIILCDGACNRAFHQFCLDPPLKSEDIPPGEEGWLCPACDSKFECLDAINDNFGTDFKIEDDWEKVFAEVEDANSVENLLGSHIDLPSDDSEDDDYNPELAKLSGAGEGQNESGSASESGSDSDSDSDSSDSGSEVEFFDEFAASSKTRKGPIFEDDEDGETCEIVEEHLEPNEELLVTGKRQRPDVDYKQLYDEVYANASDYESSADEDWGRLEPTKGSSTSQEREASEKRKEPTEDKHPAAVAGSQGRKSSSKLSKEVVLKLHELFESCQLPRKAQKQAISTQLGVSFKDVNIWFRNARRSATRKKKLAGGTNTSALFLENGVPSLCKEDSANDGPSTES